MSRNNNNVTRVRKNKDIRVRQVRLINQNGEQVGVVDTRAALQSATELGLDLVEISQNARPPVCKIMDYSKYAYDKSKKDKASKQKRKVTKTLNFNYKVDDNDLDIKINQAKKFLSKGNDVKIEMRFRGRERLHTNRMIEKMESIAQRLIEDGKASQPKLEQRSVGMMVTPRKSAAKSTPDTKK